MSESNVMKSAERIELVSKMVWGFVFRPGPTVTYRIVLWVRHIFAEM
jgi:hypothetical protein